MSHSFYYSPIEFSFDSLHQMWFNHWQHHSMLEASCCHTVQHGMPRTWHWKSRKEACSQSAQQIYCPLQVKQRASRYINPSKGAVWASVLIWPHLESKECSFSGRQPSPQHWPLCVAGGVFEEFCVWFDQWKAYLLEPVRWFMERRQAHAFSWHWGRNRSTKLS